MVDKSLKLRSDECFDGNEEDDEMDETKRKSRNLSEKKRRDQFNTLITELNTVVSANGRKMDKSTTLKAAMNILKIYSENVARSREYEINKEWKPSFLTNEEYTYLMLETLGGFILAFSSCGKILYASSNLAVGLGYTLDEILNLSIYDLVTENDRSYLENMFFISTVNNLCMQNEDQPIKFKCHFLRKSPKFQDVLYESVEFLGKIKTQEVQNGPIDHDKMLDLNKQLIFVGFIRLHTPQLYNEVILNDHLKTEFISHHNFEWKFLFLDERAPPIIGYSPFEILGTSGYDYYHVDDLDSIVDHHKILMMQDEGVSGFYRFLTKGHQWIWLQTSSYITRRQWNSRIEFIVCTHRVMNSPVSSRKNMENSETRILDSTASSSYGSGSTSCSTKTSPPSWQSTTSTSESNYYGEDEKEDERPPLRQSEKKSRYDNSTTSSSSSQSLFYQHKKRKMTKKCHHSNKTHTEYPVYPGNCSDTSSSNSNGYHSSNPGLELTQTTTSKIKFEPTKNAESLETKPSLQACLQQKCEELQQIIADRQEELRVVSEQLFLARCNPSQEENVNNSHNLISSNSEFAENIPIKQSSLEAAFPPYSYDSQS